MKKLLNTLFVTKQGVYLHAEGETVVADFEKNTLLRLPVHTLSGIICFGNVLCSPFLLGLCSERSIHISFLTEYGKFLARVEGKTSGNVLLRKAQFEMVSNPESACKTASFFLLGKVLNSRTILQRRLRDHGENESCSRAVDQLANTVKHLKTFADMDTLRGWEGDAASIYFDVFNCMVLSQKEKFSIQNRNRRPPLDPMNALLSFLYTILAHDCEAALEGVGLDPQFGFLHTLRPGRPSLALDLMEEFRASLADRFALSLINLKQICADGFKKTESGAVLMNEETRKTVLTAWQTRKREIIQHPFLNEKVEIGLLPHVQALLLARYIRGDLDAYPPFIMK